MLKQGRLRLETNYPIAADSVDHLYPHGTANDNTHWPRFVERCEEVYGYDLAMLDLGCAGGGLVYDFAVRGHDAYGLEGSDYSLRQQRAEWSTIPDRLFTCDLTKPFALMLEESSSAYNFDVITAWDVMEHIPEEALATFFANVRAHLKPHGIFVGTVSTRPAREAPDGRNYHATIRDKEWWLACFEQNGLRPTTPEPFAYEDYPRGNGNNYPANFMLQPGTGFHFCMDMR
ncbi:class I SAM-dependent methyltransferase [Methylorubrum aminovorans]